MKKYILSLIVTSTLFSCHESNEIKITKVEGSPNYENSELSLVNLTSNENLEFSFEVENYELGIQTPHEFKYDLANSGKGQHIHLIINNGPILLIILEISIRNSILGIMLFLPFYRDLIMSL